VPESRLPIPVYLNQRTVFDLLAMLQDGISQITTLTSSQSSTHNTNVGGRAAVGLASAFAGLFKIDLSAHASRAAGDTNAQSRSEERIHTPASLLFKLREMLAAKGMIQEDSANYCPEVGHFVEFATTLRRNPIIEMLDAILALAGMEAAFSTPVAKRHKAPPANVETKKERGQLLAFREMLTVGGTVDIVGESLECGSHAVITVEEEFLSDPAMADLVDGNFTVLGKVVRVVESEEGAISLIRKTAISALPKQNLDTLILSFEVATSQHEFQLPKPRWEVGGPVFQVLPIAIYA
jgi:hypothetical protein